MEQKHTRISFPNWIKIEDCKQGCIYAIHARNFKVGFFHNGIFYGVRYKCGSKFIDKELHWDSKGTAKPYKELLDDLNFHPENNYNELKAILEATEVVLESLEIK
jgi:hypothetical protein